jgi:predicted nucleic acid-binding protein
VKLVVDASVAIKWMIEEQDSALADRLLDGAHDFLAPELIVAEVISAAWKQRRRGAIDDAQFEDIVVRMADGPIECRPLRPLVPRAAAMARELDHPIYDCLYLALVEAENAPMVTADRRLVAVVRETALAGRVSLLGQVAAQ